MVIDAPLSNVQLELMKMFSHNLSDEDLIILRRVLVNFFAEKASDEMDKLWDDNNWSNETMDNWLSDDKENS